MYRGYALTLAARWRLKACLRAFNACDPPPTLPNSSSSLSFLPIFSSARMRYATGGRSRRPPPKKAANDDDDDADDDDDDDDDFDEVEDNSGYEMDYDTWNLLHQGKKENEKSRKWPLPMYKAREMVDYHMIKNRLDGLKVITDPKLEYELRKQLHEGLVEFYRRTQTAFDEIDAGQSKEAVEGGDKDPLQIAEGETKSEESGEQENTVEVVSSQVDSEDKEAESNQQLEAHTEGETATEKNEAQSQGLEASPATTLEAGEEVSAEETSVDPTDLTAMTSAVDDVIKDVFTVPELTTIGSEKDVVEVKTEGTADDEANVYNYDKWVAYREEEMAKRYAEEEQKKHATLRWKIQLVLGPGDVWHPANRKASVSVYVRELGLSKYAKQRLLALVGKRYKSPKDELTIVSERYQHRYENQKDVLRILLDLIEEAKKADQLVNDTRIGFLKAQNTELKAARTGLVAAERCLGTNL